jgi:hypothetical protein
MTHAVSDAAEIRAKDPVLGLEDGLFPVWAAPGTLRRPEFLGVMGKGSYPFIETGRCNSPRIGPECIRCGAPVTVHSGERPSSSE